MSRAAVTLRTVLALIPGCVSLDLPGQGSTPPPGQVDTGVAPDALATLDLPTAPTCVTSEDCASWLADNTCLAAACQLGRCAASLTGDQTPCSDGDPGTQGDHCLSGRCVAGPSLCTCAGSDDAGCTAFDDADPCNGRMRCNGCMCEAVATPEGSSCDDADPSTADDRCTATGACLGTRPCQCTSDATCPAALCTLSVCEACACRTFADVPGTLYFVAEPHGAVPAGMTTASTNAQTAWRVDAPAGLRATGLDGTYDHGAVTADLSTPPLALPAGLAVVSVRLAFFSAEAGCDDRVELRYGDALLSTLCGPTAPVTRHVALPPVSTPTALTLRFIANDSKNAAAGPRLERLSVARAARSACAPPAEVSLAAGPGALEQQPTIGTESSGASLAWQDAAGVWLRHVDLAGAPTDAPVLIGPGGQRPAAQAGTIAWEVSTASGEAQIAVRVGSSSPLLLPSTAARGPAVPAAGHVAFVESRASGDAVVTWLAPGTLTALATELPPQLGLRATLISDAALIVASSLTVTRLLGARTGELDGVILPATAASSGALVAVALPRASLAELVTLTAPGAEVPSLVAQRRTLVTGPVTALDVVAHGGGWIVAYALAPTPIADGGLVAVWTALDLAVQVPFAEIASYTFGDQDAVALRAVDDGLLATWRTDWFDGDASGVVVRRLTLPKKP